MQQPSVSRVVPCRLCPSEPPRQQCLAQCSSDYICSDSTSCSLPLTCSMGRRWRNRRRKQRHEEAAGQLEEFQQSQLSLQERCQRLKGRQDYSPEVITFLRWLKANGFRNEHRLQVYQYGPNQGRGICTRKRAVCVGDELMQLPVKCMMLPSVLRERNPELYEHFEVDEDCLIAVLMYQRGRIDAGLSAEWAPYVNLIPRDYGYLPLMEPNLLQRYATLPIPTSYYRLISATLIDLDRTRTRVSNIIKSNALPIVFDVDRFNWAYSVVNTRSVHPNPSKQSTCLKGDDIALVPFFDLFNHAPFGNAQVETVASEGFKMITHTPYPRFSQVYINYHEDVCNREYFAYYGFTQIRKVMSLNPVDFRHLRVSPCPQDIIYIPYTKLESILIQATERFPEYRYLKERIVERLNMLVQMNFIIPHKDIFHLRWPRTLLNNVTVQFFDSCINFEEAGKLYECVDLAGLNTNVDASLEILFSLLSKTKFENVRKKKMSGFITAAAAVSRYKHQKATGNATDGDHTDKTQPGSPLVCFEEELSIHYSLKKMLLRGWLKNEYNFDPSVPLTPVHVNQYLDQLGSLEPQLKQLFRNELGLLLFHTYQIEHTMPC